MFTYQQFLATQIFSAYKCQHYYTTATWYFLLFLLCFAQHCIKSSQHHFSRQIDKKVSQMQKKSLLSSLQFNLVVTTLPDDTEEQTEVPFYFAFHLMLDLKFPGLLHRHDSSKLRRLSKLNNIRRRNHRTCKQHLRASLQGLFLIGSCIMTNLRTGMLSFRKLMLFPFPFPFFFKQETLQLLLHNLLLKTEIRTPAVPNGVKMFFFLLSYYFKRTSQIWWQFNCIHSKQCTVYKFQWTSSVARRKNFPFKGTQGFWLSCRRIILQNQHSSAVLQLATQSHEAGNISCTQKCYADT